MAEQLRLVGTVSISGEIVVETGLTIGGTETFGIGGIDKQVVKDPLGGNRPYIPGSSLKGKMRSLLELVKYGVDIGTKQVKGRQVSTGEIHSCTNPDCALCTVFGAHDTKDEEIAGRGPTRLVVRDAFLVVDDQAQQFFDSTGRWVDLKTENYIDRLSGTAASPRTFERVPPAMMFRLDMIYRVFARTDENGGNDGEADLAKLSLVREGLELLASDYLGSSGSRGYGRISFRNVRLAVSSGCIELADTEWTFSTDEPVERPVS